MKSLEETLAWTNLPVPEVLYELHPNQQQKIITYLKGLVSHKTDGLDDLYNAISKIVKYIPNIVVIPLMTEHIRPNIAAAVCERMSISQATGYANDLPADYFTEVAFHLEPEIMAQILDRMKRDRAEQYILNTLKTHPGFMLEIAQYLNDKMLKMMAQFVVLPEDQDEVEASPYGGVIEKLKAFM